MNINMNIVFIALRNTVDGSEPPPTFAGVGITVSEALKSAGLRRRHIEAWINETSLEERTYYSVIPYDMTTSPPTRLDPPDLKRGGGPYRGERR